MQGRDKTHPPANGTIPTCENPGIRLGSPWWEATIPPPLHTTPYQPLPLPDLDARATCVLIPLRSFTSAREGHGIIH
ncbi:hypothetical protein PR048_019756 [Dryococelus australis]|uniref:Uncharacterized protein n=1 Tax=Dryococelus australis TaxID=614101 RepID=A0ABQ9H4C5_9NEOP|nr:hypothetical protein PR048_019756 [Dryococelus australis]